MTKDNRNQLMNLLNQVMEYSFDSFFMKVVRKVQPFLEKGIDVSVKCAQEVIEHPETPDENVEKIICSMQSLIQTLSNIRYSIREQYPRETTNVVPNWNSMIVNPLVVH